MTITRRRLLQTASAAVARPLIAQARQRPNVILIMTDDQGYGDVSLHGNPHLKTPHTDSIAREGVQFTQFQVCPVCAPTRASLMTGRYNYRTGVVDTYLGRAMMYPDEITVAEVLSRAGYRTGIFGKWHLGDNYPLRSIDQGFQENVIHTGGGIGQPSDPPGNTYFDPVLFRNGKPQRYRGYCTDIFFNEAARWIERNRRNPFFAYISTNAPHTPLQVPDKLVEPYLQMGLREDTAKIYGMCRNIDDNIGRLSERLRVLGLAENSMLIFLTDNGPQQERFNAGLRGRKGTVYQGGIRVPFFLQWPARVKPGSSVDRIAAHIDVLPTLLDACGAAPPATKIDGRSLMPLLAGEAGNWADRTLFTQWHRGDEPELFRACAARTQRWKLADGKELYDIESDPGEKDDVAARNPDIAKRLRAETEEWFRDVSATRGYAPPRIHTGTRHENPVTLTRQDWRGSQAGWANDNVGHWEIHVASPGRYEVTADLAEPVGPGSARLQVGGTSVTAEVAAGTKQVRFPRLMLESGDARIQATVDIDNATVGPLYVHVRKL
jgi:arylsulfatase A-like enzyme